MTIDNFKNNFKKIFKLLNISLLILFLNINFSFAQDNAAVASQNFKETANNLTNNVLATAGTLLMTAAFVLFFYGVVVFIYERATGKNSESELKKGKDFMLWGLIALFVMVSAWGIIRLAQGLFDIQSSDIKIDPVQFTPMNTGTSNTGSNGSPASNPLTPLKGTGESCQLNSECQQGLQCSNKTCVTQSIGNPLQTGSDGVTRENPFANTTIYPVLNPGDTNNTSFLRKALSMLINKNCILNGTIDYNTYNSTDVSMVKAFQQANGLSVDGIVGKDTWEALSVQTGQKTTFTGITVKNCQ